MSDDTPWKKIQVTDVDARLDAWLPGQISQLSRRGAQAFVAEGHVRVNGRVARKNCRLSPGDMVSIEVEPVFGNWRPQSNPALPLDVVLEDNAFLVVNKPGGMPSTANSHGDSHTLANAIVTRYPECAAIGARNGDAGLLHRLDNDTSGLLIVARNVRAYRSLKIMQESNQIEKRYQALVSGVPDFQPPCTISVPLTAKGKGSNRMAVASRGGQRAVTPVEEITRLKDLFLVKLLIYKGVRHQIRMHLAQRGLPICGDTLYGGLSVSGLDRLSLHAFGLRFFHPVTGVPVEVHCPLPNDLQKVIGTHVED